MTDFRSPAAGAGQANLPEYESKAELAHRLGISERTVCNLMARGLPYIALGRKLRRFPRRAVDDWLSSKQVRRS
ncbi:MAG: helix-turn-helix domain-containing protein [Verrucomicrobia bacterium]|nr:helix-turn-helix domain-containing protein [Verrucomicrobiota bacterium]